MARRAEQHSEARSTRKLRSKNRRPRQTQKQHATESPKKTSKDDKYDGTKYRKSRAAKKKNFFFQVDLDLCEHLDPHWSPTSAELNNFSFDQDLMSYAFQCDGEEL